jgi:hypothetical protein
MQNEMMPAQKFWAGLVQPGEALVVSPEDYSVTVTFASFDAASDRKDRAVLRVQFDDDDVQQVMPPSPRHLGTSSRHHISTSSRQHLGTSAAHHVSTSSSHHALRSHHGDKQPVTGLKSALVIAHYHVVIALAMRHSDEV